MDSQRILDELLALLEADGVAIRSEPLGASAGGLCAIKGQNIVVIDTQAASAEMAAQAVAELLDIENIYIRPEIRQFIENITKAKNNI